jgi:hypothetical protein|tara:strand:+ start:737 stop:1624 length:888 start_codon:yes stop_codon:yes gene_type:complete
MRRRIDKEIFGTAFLDVISCALGAVILMILLAKNGDIDIILKSENIDIAPNVPLNLALKAEVLKLESEVAIIDQRTRVLATRISTLDGETKSLSLEVEDRGKSSPSPSQPNIGTMKSIYAGGIPVGREYIIFIIDTSGSMGANWEKVMSTLTAIMDAHPKVKGLQVISDNGAYLMKGYAKKWIPDSRISRTTALDKLKTWRAWSNSSPVEGLETALKVYASRSDPVSIYVLGDDFTGKSFEAVTSTINRWNIDRNTGERRAIIHGIGFSWGLGDRYATLMREIANQNDGVFIGLQ